MSFGSLGTIWSEIGLETRKLSTGVTVAKTKLNELDRMAMTKTASINAKLSSVGSGLTSVGRNMSMYVTVPLLAMGAAATKAGMDFGDGMTKSLAIMKNVSPQMRAEMEQTAKDVVKYTTFSAKEGADAYFYLASAGLDAAQSIEALPRVAKFAQAGNFDLALATDLLTDAQSALGLTIRDDVVANMENMTRVSDVLVKANTLSNATVRQFSESLTNKAGPALRMLNKDLEEGVAVLAVYADQGIKGAEAGNYLNIILRDLQRSSINNAEAFQHFGVNVFDATGKVRNIADVIGDLESALDGMSDKEKRAALMMMGFQDRSISAMMALLGTSDAIADYEAKLRSATGFTEDVATKQMESFTASVEQLKNELVLVGIQVFDILKPRLEGLVEDVKKGIEWFDNLTDSQKDWIVSLGLVAAAIGPVLIGLGSMVRAVATLRTAIVSLNIAAGSGGLLTTLLLLAPAIAAVTQVLGAYAMDAHYAKKHFEGLEEAQAKLTAESYEHIQAIEFNIHALRNFTKEFPFAEKQMNQLTEAYVRGDITAEELNGRLDKLRQGFVELHSRGIDPALQKTGEFSASTIIAAAAEKDLEDATEDTTEELEEQIETVDDLRQAYNELVDEIFGLTNAENDLQEAEWELTDAQKAVTEAVNEFGEGSREAEQAINDYDDALQDNLRSLGELYTEEGISIERKEELRQKLIDLLEQVRETSGLSQEQFIGMATQFGLSGQEIIDMAGTMGLELDEATKQRIVDIDADTSDVDKAIDEVTEKADALDGRTVTITFKGRQIGDMGFSRGGIVGYAHGGVVGGDGARQPMLTASSGLIVPQSGRPVPVLAHENEIIANTSQQKNLAEWIMGKANTRPLENRNQPINVPVVVTLDGQIIYENTSRYQYDGINTRSRLGG